MLHGFSLEFLKGWNQNMLSIAPLVVGAVILLFGRRLFWLFVGTVGFVAGFIFLEYIPLEMPTWISLLAGLVLGVLGAVLCIFIQKIMIAIAGFLVGAYISLELLYPAGGMIALIDFVWIGGAALFCLLLVLLLFDWAIIILSALAGATIISQSLGTLGAPQSVQFLLIGMLAVAGIAVQSLSFSRKKSKNRGQ